VPNQAEWRTHLNRLGRQLAQAARRHIAVDGRRIDALAHRLQRCHPGVAVRELGQRLDELEARLGRGLERRIAVAKMRLARLGAAVAAASPKHRLMGARQRWRWGDEALGRAVAKAIQGKRQRLVLAERTLASLSPLATLERGYAIVARQDDRSIVTASASVAAGTGLSIRLARGELEATVDRTIEPAD
jgi:exodeoxyribonuclease VII large subunit